MVLFNPYGVDLEQDDDGFGDESELSSEDSSSEGDYIADAEQETAAAVEDGDVRKDLEQTREISSESELVTDEQENLVEDGEQAALEVLNDEPSGVGEDSDEGGPGIEGDSGAVLEESNVQQVTDHAGELVIDKEHGQIEAKEEEEERSAPLSDDRAGKEKEEDLSVAFGEEAGETLLTGNGAGPEEEHDSRTKSEEGIVREAEYSLSEAEAPAGAHNPDMHINSDQHPESRADDDKAEDTEMERVEDGMDHGDEISEEHVVEVSAEEAEQVDPESAVDDQSYDMGMGKESQYTVDRVESLEEETSGGDRGNLEQGSEGSWAGEPTTRAQQAEEEMGEGTAEHEEFVEASGQETNELNSYSHVAVDDESSDETHHGNTDGDKLKRDSQAAEMDEVIDESTIASDIGVRSEAQDVEGDYEEHGVGEDEDAGAPDDIPSMEAHVRVGATPSDTTESTLEEETAGEALTLEHFADQVDPSSPNASENLLDEEGNYVFEHEANQFEEYEL
ncbi:hypothetical protein NDN08_006373 [Rhodosorus marinus]|uniref:Uncharacterized protein n=1 Tax=Rhodosorus marinus TaxID=101924 RepID=A0AAV8UNA4_9RHOD|nr:hypothetical protein NDN08_006373 [Rhodosorus marinus]